ncbi:hypothetical protein ACFP2T_13425 [Plantactinospora solaniradicis]|uniref:Uncharacterized protein n=1 Tax=Plantactinospora solaniradicis TaxID=1723736 RepID=A0ABW1K862_9ACTN
MYGNWKAALDRYRAARTLKQAQAQETAEADRAQRRALEDVVIQHVPVGLELNLESSDWLELHGRSITRRLDFVVSTIVLPIMYRQDVGWVRVWGHTFDCGTAPDHGPCITLMARVGAILDAMAPTS